MDSPTDFFARRYHRQSASDDSVARFLSNGHVSVRAITSGPPSRIAFAEAGMPCGVIWHLATERARAFQVGMIRGYLVAVLVDSGSVELCGGGTAARLVPGQAGLLTADGPRRVDLGDDTELTGFLLPLAAVMPAVERVLGWEPPADSTFVLAVDVAAETAEVLRACVGDILRAMSPAANGGAVAAPFERGVAAIAGLLATAHSCEAAAHRLSTRQIRAAQDFAEASAGEPISVADLAAAAGVSVRVLQLQFRSEFGLSPMRYVKQLRLAGARRDLLAGGDAATVAEVARRWGFSNVGRFAAEYRDAFHERPSETVAGRDGGRL